MALSPTLWNRLQNWIELIANLLALAGSVYSIWIAQAGITDSIVRWTVYYLCGLVVIFIVLNFIFGYQLHSLVIKLQHLATQGDETRRRNVKLLRIEVRAARLFGEIATLLEAYEGFIRLFHEKIERAQKGKRGFDKSIEKKALHDEFRLEASHTFQKILDKTSALFSVVAGHECAVCIKLRIERTAEQRKNGKYGDLYTFMRDSASRKLRNYDKEGPLASYPCDQNTAFKSIIESPRSDFYACDNLKDEPGCMNLNQRWRELYNAVAVHAVRRPNTFSDESDEIVAFVCVDNLRGNLDRPLVREVLAIYSWHMYTFLSSLVHTRKLLTNGGELPHDFARTS